MRPRISLVVVGRNDNYGGDFLGRLQVSVDVLMSLCGKHDLSIELLLVEWNPPGDRARLADAVNWRRTPRGCRVRIIEVPNGVHRKFPKAEEAPLFEYIGKNVGVRRASGEFVLVTNADIVFAEELIEFMARTKGSRGCFYRVGRYDVEGPIPPELSVEERLVYCERHIRRINGYWGSYDNCLRQKVDLRRILQHWLDYVRWRVRYFPCDRPFTNASGDFFMMHQSHWHSLRGYPQIIGADSHGLFHGDAFLMYEALFSGLKQVRLRGRKRIYHQEHRRIRNTSLFSGEIDEARERLLGAGRPVIFNDDLWGLGGYNLPETVIA